MKVLFIDDDESMVRFMNDPRTRARAAQVEAVIVAVVCLTVAQALSAIREHAPDAVLLDHNLEEVAAGFKIVEKIRDEFPHILITSTTSDPHAVEKYFSIGIPHVHKNEIVSGLSTHVIPNFKKRARRHK